MTDSQITAPPQPATAPRDDAALLERRARLMGPAYRLFYKEPVHPVRAQGSRFWDVEGREYLDCYNNVASCGHSHPHVVAAIARQAATLNTHTRYLHEGVLDYAERLLATLPEGIGRAMFTCTGSEANDFAYRLARHATGGEGIIVTEHAYHGVTLATAECSPSIGPGMALGRHVRTIPAPVDQGAETGRIFAENVRAAARDLKRHGIRPAMLLVDTIFSSDGVLADPAGFLADGATAAREEGMLFVADEVQPGFGRLGHGMWGFARHGVLPDIVTVGKPMGAGHPMAGLFARTEIVDNFGRDMRYFNTFGGNPVSCAAGMAVLDVIEGEGLIENARTTGGLLAEGLRAIGRETGRIGAVRGAGLFLGVEVLDASGAPSGPEASALVERLRDRRILISTTGVKGDALKIRPPMVFTPADADILLGAVAEELRA